ncbi:MAG: type IV pilus twitching motility protein PilT [Candidatus Omnitrophica bacterium]|nr:MAG: Twitching mobility protein [Candidatus Hinthialibacteria bacterium OLB16]MBE7486889.1 type IV pilus twitching motility protein PilT [bacterium]MBK7495383.1 type IV pilus twitching motility protein PilT [Candidatus Omnitrophota bacterium]MCE7908809.1 type IV pilus twitching motility protein PilT [Candidatus Omnitrophica bacterium COP1]MBV6480307.1 Twitching mobility protein [bacterium]
MALEINDLLRMVVERDASDLHISVGRPPTIRVDGRLENLSSEPLTPEDSVGLMEAITPDRYREEIQQIGSCDFGYAFGNLARFRVSVLRTRGTIGIVMRLIPFRILTFDQLGLPVGAVKELMEKPRGLILVVGPTGSGKTTTLASMIDYVNVNMDHHIITIEDPIEYYHPHKRAIVTHRELNIDTPSFAHALRQALRQDPDVILVGEMRDLETMEAAITASETGHLVFATLHTNSASQTINRIVDAFPVTQQEQVRMQLSVTLAAVISQQLLPHASGKGRVAAYEIMIMTPAIANLIRERKTNRVLSSIQTGTKLGMISMDQYLLNLYNQKKITGEVALSRAANPEELRQRLLD